MNNEKTEEYITYLKKHNFNKRLAYLEHKLANHRIVIYGAGILFEVIKKEYNLEKLNIIAISDKKFSGSNFSTYLNYPTCTPSEIINLKPDVVLIATQKFFDVLGSIDTSLYTKNNIKILPLLKINILEKIKYSSEIIHTTKPIMADTNVDGLSLKNAEMMISESQFLKELLIKKQPRKILELGVASGATSTLILDTIKDIPNSHLYSIDFSTEYYRDNKKLTGFAVPDKLKNKWSLYTGCLAYCFMEKIGNDIDFCILDTTHSNPGEILDFLMIYPFLSKNCTIVIHDISRHTQSKAYQATCCLLFSSISGNKIIPQTTEHKYFPNIGAIELSKDHQDTYNQFMLLLLNWGYPISEFDLNNLKDFLKKYYDSKHIEIYEKAVAYNKDLLNSKNKNKITFSKFKQKISTLKNFIENFVKYINY